MKLPSLLSVLCLCLILNAGCGRSNGPERFNLSGVVTYNGQPVPVGEIRFSPDTQKGNSGPATLAKIDQGKFETPPQRGIIAGPMVVKIVGFDGVPYQDGKERIDSGKPLFKPYEVEVEFARETTQQDFDVPANTGIKLK